MGAPGDHETAEEAATTLSARAGDFRRHAGARAARLPVDRGRHAPARVALLPKSARPGFHVVVPRASGQDDGGRPAARERAPTPEALEPDQSELAFRRELVDCLPNLSKFALRLTRVRHLAEDLTQTTALKALENRARYEPGTRLLAWLFVMCRRLWIDEVRYHARHPGVALEDAPEMVQRPDQDDRLAMRDVAAGYEALSEGYRAVLRGAIDGRAYCETAAALGIPVGTVRSRLWRARVKLAEIA